MFLLAVFIILLTVVVGVLPSIFKIRHYVTHNVTAFGYFYYFIVIILIVVTSVQYNLNDQISIDKDNDLKIQRDSATSIIRRGIDSGNKANNEFLAAAFNQQGINIDSLKRIVRKIAIDTSNKTTVINTIEEAIPDIDFDPLEGIRYIKRTLNSWEFKFAFKSKYATAENVELKVYPVVKVLNGPYVKAKTASVFSDGEMKFPKDVTYEMSYFVDYPNADSLEYLYVVAKGSYWTSKFKKRVPIYAIQYYIMAQKTNAPMARRNDHAGVLPYLEPK